MAACSFSYHSANVSFGVCTCFPDVKIIIVKVSHVDMLENEAKID
jgi:hypothetical protein